MKISLPQLQKTHFVLLRGEGGGGLFDGIPMVADGRGVGVKNRENLPTS